MCGFNVLVNSAGGHETPWIVWLADTDRASKKFQRARVKHDGPEVNVRKSCFYASPLECKVSSSSPPLQALRSNSPLIVYVDIKSPYAFVAYGPTLALERELGIEFDWRPLTLDIPSYLGSAKKKDGEVVESQGRSERIWRSIKYSYKDARRYAERQGLVLKGTEKIWNSRQVNVAMYWVATFHRHALGSFLDAVYPSFWARELDIEDPQVVTSCIEQAGVDSTGFTPWLEGEGGALHDALQSQFHEEGIYGVPTYVLEETCFFGREHIPYLRWALSGRVGAAPDIAYELLSC